MIASGTHRRPEHALLCRLARSHAPYSRLETTDSVDWTVLLDVADRHGVTELLLPALRRSASAVPSEVLAHLEQHFLGATALNLSRTMQLTALVERFRAHGIRALPFKGPTFAVGILGDLGLRLSSDIDLLVAQKDAAHVRPLMLAGGYQLLPRPRHRNGSLIYGLMPTAGRSDTLVPDDPGLASVDIHVGFAHWTQGIRLDIEEVFDRSVTVDLPGGPVATMCPEDLLLILAIHGMMHNWHYLRLVSDIQAVADHVRDWDAVARRARTARMRRVLFVALLLAHDLMEASVPRGLLAEARSDQGAEAIAASVANTLFADPAPSSVDFDPAEWQLSFQDGRGGRARFHVRRWIYEWFLKWPWDEWLGRRRTPGAAGVA